MPALRSPSIHLLLAAALLVVAVLLRVADPAPVSRLRLSVFDTYLDLAPRQIDPSLPVRIVDIAKVTCPVLVVSGSDDKVISAATGRKVAGLYANATFEEAAGRGHFLIMEEGAAKLAGRCADWLASVTK